MITAAQCRAARSLLKWKQTDLVEKTNLSAGMIRDFELEKHTPRKAGVTLIQKVFEDAGIEFLDDKGVTLK